MKIRRLSIENFRGVKTLDWVVPANQRLLLLVGPGDSGKSTVLDAIHYLFGDRWNIPFSDTDFYNTDVTTPISIRAVVTDISPVLMKETAFGFWLSGLGSDGSIHQDPSDEDEVALIARLVVDSSLEPKWTIERANGESRSLSAEQRRSFSTFKVDDRNDTQLRWTRTSALGRMSARDGGDLDALAAASRAARDALADHKNSSLSDLASRVQERANKIGGGDFRAIKPGLDTSRSSMGAGLALYEDVIPLTSFGLGSRRLTSLAVQELAAGERSVAVVDELESGLEPHRAINLMNYLLDNKNYSQIVVTTHSPVVVEAASTENLAIVQSKSGEMTITSLSSTKLLQRLQRSRPSSFLARRVVVVEGKTEHGLMLSLFDKWNDERSLVGLSSTAGEGVSIQDGEGGSEVAIRATALSKLGIISAGFMDNDDRSADKAVVKAQEQGVLVVRWETGMNTESQVISSLKIEQLDSLLQVAVTQRVDERTVLNDINAVTSELEISTLSVQDWIDHSSITLEEARKLIACTAHEKSWFRLVAGGKALGEWLIPRLSEPEFEEISARIKALHRFVFPDPNVKVPPVVSENVDGSATA